MPSHAPIITYKQESKIKRPKGGKKKHRVIFKNLLPVGLTCGFLQLVKDIVFNVVKVSKIPKQISTNSSRTKSHISDIYDSPITTRLRSKLILASTEASSKDSPTKSSLDLITKSVLTEKTHQTFNFSSMSYIKIPNKSKVREQQIIYSSTPCTAPRIKIGNDTMSPVTNLKSSNQISIIKEDSPRRESKIRSTTKKFLEQFEKKTSCNQNEFEDNPKSVTERSFSAVSVRDSCDEKGESSVFNVMKNPESSINTSKNYFMKPTRNTIIFRSGKLYRRSHQLVRRNSILPRSCLHDGDFETELDMPRKSRKKTSKLPVEEKKTPRRSPRNNRISENSAQFSIVQIKDLLDNLNSNVQNLSLSHSTIESKITAKDVVLRRCGQTEVISFEEMYPPSVLKFCEKIGEGAYGEVFLYRKPKEGITVMKIIPVEGKVIVNGQHQKKFDEVLSEIIIAQELSKLRLNQTNMTRNFSKVRNIRCTQGKYPEQLLELWDLYKENKNSENDSPEIFECDQHYVILEFANGGYNLESYVFNNAQEAYSIFQQTACALAVAEAELSFEHRDLHGGNILVKKVDKLKSVNFCLEGKQVEIKTSSVEATIIDFNLSRLQVDGVVIFNNLSADPQLFSTEGDHKFEIYRLMQKSNGNEWQHFEPYTNILWLHYVLSKLPQFRYKNPKTKVHEKFSSELNKIKEEILAYRSVKDFARAYFFSNV